MRNLMKQKAKMRKNATSFRPKKHQDENASEASDFLCTRFQMSTKHMEPVTTIRNQYMFLQEVEKKETDSHCPWLLMPSMLALNHLKFQRASNAACRPKTKHSVGVYRTQIIASPHYRRRKSLR